MIWLKAWGSLLIPLVTFILCRAGCLGLGRYDLAECWEAFFVCGVCLLCASCLISVCFVCVLCVSLLFGMCELCVWFLVALYVCVCMCACVLFVLSGCFM